MQKRLLRHIAYQFHRGTLPFRSHGFSTFNEEAILHRYIDELLPPDHPRTAVDLGAGDGRTGSNTLALFKRGWNGLSVEFDSRKLAKLAKLYEHLPEVSACRYQVTPDNVVALLETYSINRDFSVLSVDIDSYDYWVLDAVLSRYRPGLVITEINEKVPPPIKFRAQYDPDFSLRDHFYGYSIESLAELCRQREYALIDLEYNNAFLSPVELAGERALSAEQAYRRGYLERPDRREQFYRNENMEILHSLHPEEGVKFLQQYWSKFDGKFELGIATPDSEKELARTALVAGGLDGKNRSAN